MRWRRRFAVKRTSQRLAWLAVAAALTVRDARALVYCVTNAVDYHQAAPTGALADSGWQQTVPIDKFLGTVIHSNAMLNAQHIWELNVGDTFTYEGAPHTVTSIVADTGSDLSVLFFTSSVTNFALLNIETNDIGAPVVLQGRGAERGEVVTTGAQTNGWKWDSAGWSANPAPTRRWGVNQYAAESADGLLAIASFDNNGDPDECMLSVGDSGGPGFIRTGSGWKLATINYSVDPATFTLSTNPASPFEASLYDCAGLYYTNNGAWTYVPLEAAPAPCVMLNTRTVKRIAWITNTVAGITFPADVGVAWRCATNRPSAACAATGLWFEVVATNAGPYAARDVAVDLAWAAGLRPGGSAASQGSLVTNRWLLPVLPDGGAATLRVDAVVWRASAGWGTNAAAVTASDKPDPAASNNTSACVLFLPETATRLMVK